MWISCCVLKKGFLMLKKKISLAYDCVFLERPLNIDPSIIMFVEGWQQTKNTTTAVGFYDAAAPSASKPTNII